MNHVEDHRDLDLRALRRHADLASGWRDQDHPEPPDRGGRPGTIVDDARSRARRSPRPASIGLGRAAGRRSARAQLANDASGGEEWCDLRRRDRAMRYGLLCPLDSRLGIADPLAPAASACRAQVVLDRRARPVEARALLARPVARRRSHRSTCRWRSRPVSCTRSTGRRTAHETSSPPHPEREAIVRQVQEHPAAPGSSRPSPGDTGARPPHPALIAARLGVARVTRRPHHAHGPLHRAAQVEVRRTPPLHLAPVVDEDASSFIPSAAGDSR